MSTVTYFIAVLLSVLMHGLLMFLLSFGWQHRPTELAIRPPMEIVQASLVELEAKAPPKAAPQPEVVDLSAQRQLFCFLLALCGQINHFWLRRCFGRSFGFELD